MNYHNIPPELRALDQWVVAGENKVPLNPRTGGAADPTDPSTWGTYEEAIRAGYLHVGFVLSSDDPYCIIDLDDPFTRNDNSHVEEGDPDHPLAVERSERHKRILESIDSYAETSQSGRGVHIVVKGGVPRGVRRDKVEIYSDSRYMIFTGDVIKPSPISEEQEILDVLYHEMSAHSGDVELVELGEERDDASVMALAVGAENGEKFQSLFDGDFSTYPSQSEADLALMSILAFYSRSNEQCRRIFRKSELGQRRKARTDRYLDYMLRKIRAKQMPSVDVRELIRNAAAVAPVTQPTAHAKPPPPPKPAVNGRSLPAAGKGPPPPPIPRIRQGIAAPDGLFPPGFVGDLARHFLSSAIRPVPEIALASSLALMAGVVGRSYNVSGTGLNQYLILVAKTGSGKEGIANAIDSMVAEARKVVPSADRFMGPAAFASGQALVKVLNDRPCFVSVLGEFGITLQQLCDPRAPTATSMLKKIILDLYGKSGFNKVLRPSVYSDTEKNTKMVQAPNVTILGETTPETFYGNLDSSHVMEGLIPRFTVIEYNGPRPDRNRNAFHPPPAELVDTFANYLTVALSTEQNHTCAPISIDADALALLDSFDERVTARINDVSTAEVERHLWNRAHLKALKIAGLIAVGVDAGSPVITRAVATWALDFIERDVRAMATRFAIGDVGEGQSKQEHDLRRAIDDYLRMTAKERATYKVVDKLACEALVPYGYLRRRLRMCASFKNDRNGFARALDQTLDSMCKAGDLVMVPPVQAKELYDARSPLYGVGASY